MPFFKKKKINNNETLSRTDSIPFSKIHLHTNVKLTLGCCGFVLSCDCLVTLCIHLMLVKSITSNLLSNENNKSHASFCRQFFSREYKRLATYFLVVGLVCGKKRCREARLEGGRNWEKRWFSFVFVFLVLVKDTCSIIACRMSEWTIKV